METIVKRSHDLSRLARDIAMDILEVPDILTLHQVSEEDWERIARSPQFEAMLREIRTEWMRAENTKARVKIKAATGVEAVLEQMLREIIDPRIPFAQRVEGLKVMMKLGELGEVAVAGAGTEKVTIQIFTSPEKPPVTIEAKPSREATDVVQ